MLRFTALSEVQKKQPVEVSDKGRASELFACNVFHEEAMRQRMTCEAFESVMTSIRKGCKIDRQVADQVAIAMRDWAISRGATIPIGSNRSLEAPPKSTMLSLSLSQAIAPLNNFRATNSYNRSLMPQASTMGAYVTLLKHVAIRLGILPLLPLYMGQYSVSQRFLSPIQERLWTIRLPCSKPLLLLTKPPQR